MADFVAAVILLILVGGAAAYIVKAKKSGVKCIGCPAGGSCPGSGKLPRKKLDAPVIGTKIIKISGMHCQNCVNSVTNALNAVDGVSAKVSLSSGSAEVSYDRTVDELELRRAVEEAGFEAISIL